MPIQEVQSILEALKPEKATGPDEIPARLLKETAPIIIGRRQHVTLLGTVSRELPVTSGVPQRFILGPALLLIYLNSLPSAV